MGSTHGTAKRAAWIAAAAIAVGGLGATGCNEEARNKPRWDGTQDGGRNPNDDGGEYGGPNGCGGYDPTCTSVGFGPPASPIPLSSDPPPGDPYVADNGVDRDPNGWLILGTSRASFDFLWIANSSDWGVGTVSKINSRSVREVARYATVTCWSNPGVGSRAACDGTNGCCAMDDHPRFTRRAAGQPAGAAQAVSTAANAPSRTAVDFNGDVWVANRAFGGQSSVTKIANEPSECTDRNGRPGIQTSSDQNGDGLIDTDCNRNGVPDDLADVAAAPCQNGMAQEYWHFDDECVLFTTNTGEHDKWGRPLALGRGSSDTGPADAWAGLFYTGKFFRVDGVNGKIKSQAQVPCPGRECTPYGAVVDGKGILWAKESGGGYLSYFDTANPGQAGYARMPGYGVGGYGIAIDRDQNVWMGGYGGPHAYRYTPNRAGFQTLGQGFWTMVTNPGLQGGASGCQGRGIAADSRTPTTYFVWMACHGSPYIVRIDASAIPLPMGADTQVDGAAMPAIHVAGNHIAGAGVDIEQNVWGIASTGAAATRIKVDINGTPSAPDVAGGSPGGGCPVGNGDRCHLRLNAVNSDPGPYTYSDFTGFGLRNFTNPRGTYSYIVRGCNAPDETRWIKAEWESELPPSTTLTAQARSGKLVPVDATWTSWTPAAPASPLDLSSQNGMGNSWLQIQFDLATQDRAVSPKLKNFRVWFECGVNPG